MDEKHADLTIDTWNAPEFRIRINTARNSSGVTFDVTTSMTWTGTAASYQLDGHHRNVDDALAELNEQAHAQLTYRIEQAKAIDTFVPKPPKEVNDRA